MEKPLRGHKQSHRKFNIKGTITNCQRVTKLLYPRPSVQPQQMLHLLSHQDRILTSVRSVSKPNKLIGYKQSLKTKEETKYLNLTWRAKNAPSQQKTQSVMLYIKNIYIYIYIGEPQSLKTKEETKYLNLTWRAKIAPSQQKTQSVILYIKKIYILGNLRVTITQWSSWTWIEWVLHIQYQIGI